MTREPTSVRVPRLSLRRMTQCRKARSASLFVGGSAGCCNTWKMASQSLSHSTQGFQGDFVSR